MSNEVERHGPRTRYPDGETNPYWAAQDLKVKITELLIHFRRMTRSSVKSIEIEHIRDEQGNVVGEIVTVIPTPN